MELDEQKARLCVDCKFAMRVFRPDGIGWRCKRTDRVTGSGVLGNLCVAERDDSGGCGPWAVHFEPRPPEPPEPPPPEPPPERELRFGFRWPWSRRA